MKVYALKNCDTCKKALKWLSEQGIAHETHDIRADGVDASSIAPIVEALGWETALNRRSTTWRTLSDADKTDIDDTKAVTLILDHPTLMKRPVFVTDHAILCGFDAKTQKALKLTG